MEMSLSLSERDSVQKALSGPQLGSQGYPMKVTLRKMAQFINGVLPTFFRTLFCSEGEIDITIGFGYFDLVHFHASHL